MIADDLSGGCDAGVQFARNGFKTIVLRDREGPALRDAELTVLSTASRNDAPDVAREKVTQACRWMMEQGIRVIYKKIDSTLLGNAGPEIEAVMNACGFPAAVVTPAFPEMGRVVVGGRLETCGGSPSLDVRARLPCSAPLQVADAKTPRDLAAVVQRALASEPPLLLVGSAGLALHLANALAARLGRPLDSPAPPRRSKPVLFLIGSTQSVTQEQLDYLRRHGLASTIAIDLFDTPALVRACEERKHLVVPLPIRQTPDRVLVERLAFLCRDSVSGIVLSGGDTAEAVCRSLRIAAIELFNEVERGIPWGRLIGGGGDGLIVVTKAGGFGRVDSLVSIAASLSSWETTSAA